MSDSDEIIIDRIRYRSIRDAAQSAGVSASYVSKFCREGSVRAIREDGVWYVNEKSLRDLLVSLETRKREWYERLAKERQEERGVPAASAPAPIPAPVQISRDENSVPLPKTLVAPRVLHRIAHERRAKEASLRRTVAIASIGSILFLGSLGIAFSGLAPIGSARGGDVASVSSFGGSIVKRFTSFFDSIFAVNDYEYRLPTPWQKTTIEKQADSGTVAVAETGNVYNTNNNYVTNYIQPQVGSSLAVGGVSEQLLDSRLNAMENYLTGRIDLALEEGRRQTSDLGEDIAGIGGAGFDDIDITDSTFTGGSISGSSLSSVTFSGSTAFYSITMDEATTTNLYVDGSFGFGSDTGLLRNTAGVVDTLTNGSNGQVLKMVGSTLTWGTDNTGGGGGGSSFFASTSDDLAIYPADTDDVVIIGASATTTVGNILEIAGNSLFRGAITAYGITTGSRFVATSSVASVLPYASTTALSTNTLCISGECRSAWAADSSFSTTSADYWKGVNSFFSTTSEDYYKSVNNFFSTSSASYFSSVGLAFSTTSSDAWKDARNFFSTTSSDYWKTVNNFFSTTSVDYYRSVTDLFSTTSAIYFAHSSTTIPKTYTANTFTGLQSFVNASSTLLSSSYASSTSAFFGNLSLGSLSGLLKATNGLVSAAVAGTDYANFGYLFPGNATTTGLGIYASTTIGAGGQATGLTISGGATTTGNTVLQGTLNVTGATTLSSLNVSNGGLSSLGTDAGRNVEIHGNDAFAYIDFATTTARNYDFRLVDTMSGLFQLASYINPTIVSITASGNVGIGTTTPSTLLSLAGTSGIYASTTATSTFQGGGINLITAAGNTGCFAINGVCLGGGSSLTGTLGQTAYFSGTDTAVGTSTLFIHSNSSVGIGTTTPQHKLSLFDASASQLSLSAGAGIAQWAFRNAGGDFFLSTTTVAGTATTSLAALTVSGSGFGTTTIRGLSILGQATSTSNVGFNLSDGCFAVGGTCIGGSSGSSGSGGGQLLATYSTSTVGTTTVNFNGTAGSAPSFSGATLTLPSNTSYIVVEVWGAGGGGGGGNGSNGVAGNMSCLGTNAITCSSPTMSATGGAGGVSGNGAGGAGGVGSGGDINMSGQGGSGGPANSSASSQVGGSSAGGASPRGGGGGIGGAANGAGGAGNAFGGGGGGGGSDTSAANNSGGGGGGGYSQKLITSPSGTYYYSIGAGGAGGTGVGGAGGAGGAGGVVINVYTTGISQGAIGSGTAGFLPYYTSDVASTSLSATSTLFLSTSGKFGIGSTTPGSLLSIGNIAGFQSGTSTIYTGLKVTGNLDITGLATSTFANGLNLTGGCIAVNGSCIGGSSLTGTQGQVAFFTGTNTAAGTSTLTIGTDSNVGLGSSTPSARLAVQGSGTGTGRLAAFANSALTTVMSILDNGMAYFLGNLGVGTTTPWRKFSVQDTVSNPQMAIAYDATRYAAFQVDSTGDLTFDAQGGDIFATDENFFACASGCPSGNPSGTGNIVAENKLGIGTTTPAAKLTIETQDSTTDFMQIASTTAQSIFTIKANGKVGVATSSPFARFTIGAGGALVVAENNLTDGATVAIDWLQGNQQRVVLGGNRSVTFANYIAGQILRVVMCQDATGSRTVSWPAIVRWSDGSAPTLTTTANRCDIVSFIATEATSTLVVSGSLSIPNF